MKIINGDVQEFLPVILTLESETELKVLRDALYKDNPEEELEQDVNADLFYLVNEKCQERDVIDVEEEKAD